MIYFEPLRFVPHFIEAFNFTHLAGQIWQYIHLRFQFAVSPTLTQSLRFALPILRLNITTYPYSEMRQFSFWWEGGDQRKMAHQ